MESLAARLWPKPQSISVIDIRNNFNLVHNAVLNVTVKVTGSHDFDSVISVLECHQSAFRELNFALQINGKSMISTFECEKNVDGDDNPNADIRKVYELKCCVNALFFSGREQCFELTLTDHIEVLCNDFAGLHYAFLTLIQILKYIENGPVLPYFRVRDYPVFVKRGVCVSGLLKCLKPESFKYFVGVLAALRINQLFYEISINGDSKISKETEDVSQIIPLRKLCSRHLINVCPVFELDGEWQEIDLDMSFVERFVFRTQQYFSDCKILFVGPKLSKRVVDLENDVLQSFLERFSSYAICLSDVEPTKLPFGCGLMSKPELKVPSQLYHKVTIGSFSLAANISNFVDVMSFGPSEKPLGITLIESERDPIFQTSLIFHIPSTIISCGFMWNSMSRVCDIDINVVVNEFMKHYVLNSNCRFADLGKLILDIGNIESSLYPQLSQLMTNPDEVSLNVCAFESLTKCSKQIRQIRSQLSTFFELDINNERLLNFAHEALLICEIIQFTVKLGRALCQAGRNPAVDKIGFDLVNLGISNLPPTVKTDLANNLLSVIEKFKSSSSSNYCDEIVSKNTIPLYRLLESLIPENPDSQDSDFQCSLTQKQNREHLF